MTEDLKKPDINALGAHFGQQLVKHAERHEKTVTKSERDQHLTELKSKIRYIAESPFEGLGSKGVTNNYEVDTLDTGTRVAARLSSKNLGGVKVKAESLISRDEDKGGGLYLQNGPISAHNYGIFENGKPGEGIGPILSGLIVEATLETATNKYSTMDRVFVGEVLDPESIKVPELNTDPSDQTERFSVIGPSDPRFEPIMDMVAMINQGVGTWGEKPHTG